VNSAAASTVTPTEDPQDLNEKLRREIRRVISVSDEILDSILVAFMASGHVLIEGIPGTGKTLLSRTLARCLDCDFKRIQFTNDLMPSDIVGSSIWRPAQERFEFIPGPLFGNIILADEVNRTSSRTMSCLLEAMEAGSVSVEGRAMPLADPFLIMATRNPIEFHGTFPIPEAMLDRFLVRVELGYPDPESECALYMGEAPEEVLSELQPVLSSETLIALRAAVPHVTVSEPICRYALSVADATRKHPAVALGVSPRAAMSWIKAAKGLALMSGRSYVVPDDLKGLAQSVLGHRVFLKDGSDARSLIEELTATLPVDL
jgi:MoxR-like ATPase